MAEGTVVEPVVAVVVKPPVKSLKKVSSLAEKEAALKSPGK